jgi:protein SCO1/2
VKVRLLALAAAFVLTACGSAAGGRPGPSALNDVSNSGPYDGVGLTPPLPRPQFTMTDTAGKPYSFSRQTAGRTTLLFFGYTRCADVCPQTMADIGVALRELPVAVQRATTVVFVSTDVKHDTAPVIRTWLAKFTPGTHASFVGLRGTQAQVDAAQSASHVMIAEDGGQTHSSQVMLYSPDDYAHVSFLYNGKNEATQMAHDLRLVANG